MENTHKVPAKQWGKWSIGARRMFNTMYEFMKDNREFCVHSKQREEKFNKDHWEVTAWNAAFMAACEFDLIYRLVK